MIKTFDNNISLLRVTAILCIVLHHSFCVFGSSPWPPNEVFFDVSLPVSMEIFSRMLKIFGLSVFTFVSGYCLFFSFQKKLCLLELLKNKAKRILLPAFVFGLLYQMFFPQFMHNTFPSLINGTHLWYLPMLFLCMVILILGNRIKHIELFSLFVWLGLYFAIKFHPLPLGRTLYETFRYLPVFVLGYEINRCFTHIKNVRFRFSKLWYKTTLACVLIGGIIIYLSISVSIYFYLEIIFSLSAYIIAKFFWKGRKMNVMFYNIDKSSFTIYLLHQFVINAILYFRIASTQSWSVVVMLLFIFSIAIPLLLNTYYSQLLIRLRHKI